MRGVDTNVLVRLIVQDDAEQARKAVAALRRTQDAGESLHVSVPTLIELIWVLKRRYRLQKKVLIQILDQLLETHDLHLQHRDLVRNATDRFRRGRADFADYLIGEENDAAGARPTLTFDRKLAAEPGYELVD